MPTINLGKPKSRERTVNKQLYQDFYQDPRWRALRDQKIRNNPVCEQCEARGKTILAREVHHKIPFQLGRTPEEIEHLAFDYDNTESLCVPCHKKADQDIRKGKIPSHFVTHFIARFMQDVFCRNLPSGIPPFFPLNFTI